MGFFAEVRTMEVVLSCGVLVIMQGTGHGAQLLSKACFQDSYLSI